jgi:hypothetical protein
VRLLGVWSIFSVDSRSKQASECERGGSHSRPAVLPGGTMSVGPEITYEPLPDGFDPSAEIAIEVLAVELGDFYGPSDVIRHAAAWEAVNGRPLKLPLEMESWADYAKRKKKFKPLKPYIADAMTLADDIKRLLSMEEPTDEAELKAHRARIHELEAALSRPLTDFSKPRAVSSDIADSESVSRFKAIQTIETWSDRVTSTSKERDIGCLNLLSMRDSRPEVRAAAMTRILELQTR